MPYRAVLFDLDGTLLDTLADIANSVNDVLEGRGFPAHEIDAYRDFVGDGVEVLFRRALPSAAQDPDVISACSADFRQVYGRNWNVCTRPYDGIPELLGELSRRGLSLAVLSNKPDDATRQCTGEYFPAGIFPVVMGQRDGVPRKPDATAALAIAHALATPPDQCVFLGDTATDMETARNAGMMAVGALWGFRQVQELRQAGAQALIDHPKQLLDVLEGRETRPVL